MYAAAGVLLGTSASFATSLVTVDLPFVAGSLGTDLVKASWLS